MADCDNSNRNGGRQNGKGKRGISDRNGVSIGCPFARLVQYRLVSGQRHVNECWLFILFFDF